MAGKDYGDDQETCCNAKATGVIPAEFFVTAREREIIKTKKKEVISSGSRTEEMHEP